MRFYQCQHESYGGVDLHAKTMHVCRVNQDRCLMQPASLTTQARHPPQNQPQQPAHHRPVKMLEQDNEVSAKEKSEHFVSTTRALA